MICDYARQVNIRSFGKRPSAFVRVGALTVRTTTTPAGFGGVRTWFLCPRCYRRCAILYLPDARWRHPRCRTCGNGRYVSELKSPADRQLLKAIRHRERLGQFEGGVVAPFPPKPKWMRWHTYLRHMQKAASREQSIWQTLETTLNIASQNAARNRRFRL